MEYSLILIKILQLFRKFIYYDENSIIFLEIHDFCSKLIDYVRNSFLFNSSIFWKIIKLRKKFITFHKLR